MNVSNIICIAGMHRSGTSMVARLLHASGLFLGPEDELMDSMPDNPRGFWENQEFVAINDELLSMFWGAWDYPSHFPPDWLDDEKIAGLRVERLQLRESLAAQQEVIRSLEKDLEERTDWAKRSSEEASKVGGIILELQEEPEARIAWANQSADTIVACDAIIRDLQARLEKEIANTRDTSETVAAAHARVRDLHNALQERAQPAKQLADNLAASDLAIRDLRKELDAQSASAKKTAEQPIANIAAEMGEQQAAI